MNSQTKTRIKSSIKILITLVLIYLFYSKINLTHLKELITQIKPLPIVIFFCFCFINMFISSYRWSLLLKADGIHIPLIKLFTSHWIASFFNFFAPSNIGGDVYRIADIADKSGRTINTVASVFIDRLSGFIAMSILGFTFPLIGLKHVPSEHQWMLLIPLCVFVGFLTIAFLFLQQTLLRKFLFIFPKKIKKHVETILDKFLSSINAYKQSKGVLVKCLLLSLVFQFFIIIAISSVGYSLGFEISFYEYCIFSPLVCILESIPLTINGMGFRDLGYTMFFNAVNLVDIETKAPTMAFLYLTLTLLYTASGGLIFLRRQICSSKKNIK